LGTLQAVSVSFGPPPPPPRDPLLQALGVVLQISNAVLTTIRIPIDILNASPDFDASPLLSILTTLIELNDVGLISVNLLQPIGPAFAKS